MSTRRAALATLAASWPLALHAADAFAARDVAGALAALGIADAPQPSPFVHLSAPDVAENGAVVPLTLATSAPDATHLILLVDGNPVPLVAVHELTPLLAPKIELRIKMAQGSPVRLVVRLAGGGALMATRRVAVIQGGCGGE